MRADDIRPYEKYGCRTLLHRNLCHRVNGYYPHIRKIRLPHLAASQSLSPCERILSAHTKDTVTVPCNAIISDTVGADIIRPGMNEHKNWEDIIRPVIKDGYPDLCSREPLRSVFYMFSL